MYRIRFFSAKPQIHTPNEESPNVDDLSKNPNKPFNLYVVFLSFHFNLKLISRLSSQRHKNRKQKKTKISNFMSFNSMPDGMDKDLATLVCKNLRLANSTTLRKLARKFYGIELPSSRAALWKMVKNVAIKARDKITSEIVHQESLPSLEAHSVKKWAKN